MNTKLNNILLLALGYMVTLALVRFANTKMKTNSSDRVLVLRALLVVLTVYVVYDMFNSRERFHFKVSPSKTVDCCPRGFSGMPVEFHYQGDSTRFKNCTENQKGQIFPIQTSNYKLLDDVYSEDSKENFYGKKDPMDYSNLNQVYASETEPVVEEYCGACAV